MYIDSAVASAGLSMDVLRRIAVHAGGVARQTPFGRGRPGAARALEHLGHVQLDTISVVTRAHDHILASRVPGFHSGHLQQLIARREAFEYWAHAAAFLPMTDFRHALPRMQRLAAGGRHWARADRHEMARVLDRIRAEGPLRARDFAAPPDQRSGWWEWKPAKRALERLFHEGSLMVTAREGFEKRFDLTARVLPTWVDTSMPDLAEHAAWLVTRARRYLGVFTARHARYQRREVGLVKAVDRALTNAVEAGEVLQITHPGRAGNRPWFVDAAAVEACRGPISRRAQALSPFDPLVIHRDRLAALFDFDYQIECYLPAAKRRYGYFSLPLLAGTRFIGRADCKAERRQRVLTCRHLALEPAAAPPDVETLRRGLVHLAHMNDCEHINVIRVSGIDALSASLAARGLSGPA